MTKVLAPLLMYANLVHLLIH